MRESTLLNFAVFAFALIFWSASVGCDDLDNVNGQSGETESKSTAQIADGDEVDLREETAQQDTKQVTDSSSSDQNDRQNQTIEIPDSWKRIGKEEEIWIDTKAKEVIIAGHVCLNQGPLEMFICPEHTKEHESVIAAHATALQVHLALTALGFDPGSATSWDPEYRAAYGPTIKVTLKWQDRESKTTKTALANQWIRDVKTEKAMEHLWVFGGSQFWEDPDTDERIYYGDSGELICLSNFSTATIDVNVESSQSNDGLLFEAFTENIPPVGTKVYAIIKPGKRIEPKKKADSKPVVETKSDDQSRTQSDDEKTEDK